MNDTPPMPEPRLTEARYREIVDSAHDFAILSCDLDGRITTWSEGARRMFGWSQAEALGKPMDLIFAVEDQHAGAAALERAIALEQGAATDERWHVRRNGGRFWASGQLTPLVDGGTGPVGFVKILRDRTEQKRNEAQLHASEARLRLALEAGEMGAWEWDLQTDEVRLLHGADLLHGFPPSDAPLVFHGMDDYVALVHPEDRPLVSEVIRQAREEGKDHRVEYRILRSDGSQQWIEVRGTVYSDESGKPALMSGVSVNITRRKRTEQDLQFLARASAELSGLVDPQSTLDKLAFLSVPTFADWCAIDLLSDEGGLERVAVAHIDPAKVKLARELAKRFPADPNQPIGAWSVIRSGEPRLVTEISDAVIDQGINDPEYRRELRELGLRSYMAVPMIAHGKTMGVATFVSAESGRQYQQADLDLAADLARRAAVSIENAHLYRTLQQSDRGKDIFLATLAHELRNPLAAIANGIGILKLAPGDEHRVERAGAIMERQVNQLRRLVDDLMDVSRVATGKIELRKEDTDLVTVITSAIETARPEIEAAHHKLSVALPGSAMPLRADPVRLAQVFANLLSNAAKYTNDGGQIEILMDTQPDEYVVRVRDTGIGIGPELLKNVFAIFRQGTHPLERNHSGLGIGLSLVEGLVRLHGGRVEAFSDGPGRGSEFVVHLPRTFPLDAGEPATAAAEPLPGQDRVRRVLVVDDNVDAANTVSELLRLLGHEVRVGHDGLEAVSAAAEWRPDLVLLDIGLPGIDGYEAARRIRCAEGRRSVELVALTGWGQEGDKERAFRAGFDQHCVKPIGLDQLREILRG